MSEKATKAKSPQAQSTISQSRPAYKESVLLAKFRNGSDGAWWSVFTLVMFLALATRLYSLHFPNEVCWDETHFGKHAGFYINRTFFFDVHPPLGKMLIGLFGYLDGYNATFSFEKPGVNYGDYPIYGMRLGCALMGAMLVPFSFLTVWEMTFSLPAATFAGLLIMFDNGMLTLTRYILLDAPLLFFISGSVYTSVKFNNQRHRPFSLPWWFWMSSVGIMLAGAVGVKFVGFFVVFTVGVRTISELWDILGDVTKPLSYTVKHFLARALCLIVLPILVYMGIYYIHLKVLYLSGVGDHYVSSDFQTSLINNPLRNETGPRDVAYGSMVRLRNKRIDANCKYLHSCREKYPEGVGAPQQIVTTFNLKDGNNWWFFKKLDGPRPEWNSTEPIEYVRNGDLVRLEHKPTKKQLHTHYFEAAMTPKHFQVTTFGYKGRGNDDDVWRLVIENAQEGEILQVIKHRFRLIHDRLKCILVTTNKNYPEWGFVEREVACNPYQRDDQGIWTIEDHFNPRLPNISYTELAPGFLERFIESHKVQFTFNAYLKPGEFERPSRPWMWPIDLKGQGFCPDSLEGPTRIYLLGNPIIWWGNLLFMAGYFALYAINAIRNLRGIVSSERQQMLQDRALHACGWLLIGWAIHYIPFWGMGRVLYYHHYFPALLFASMLSGVIIDYLLECVPDLIPQTLSDKSYLTAISCVLLTIFYAFYLFAPLSYGYYDHSTFPNSTMYGLNWLPTWDF